MEAYSPSENKNDVSIGAARIQAWEDELRELIGRKKLL